MKLFDSHAHVFKVGLPLASVRRYAPDYDAFAEDFIGNFTRHQLDMGLLIQPSFLGTDNSYMLEAIKQYPDRLLGVAVIDPEMSLEEMKQLKEQGIIGIRLNLVGREIPDFDTPVWQNCLAQVKSLNWHVAIHRESKDIPEIVDPLLNAGVHVVIDHFGKPDPVNPLEDRGFKYLLSVGKTQQVWVKVSGWYRVGKGEQGVEAAKIMVPELIEAYGTSRLMWGSDWPHTAFESEVTYDKAFQVLETIVPNETTREEILGKSILDLL